MQVDVYDSYARSADGSVIHFDVLVERGDAAARAVQHGQAWLISIGEDPEMLDQTCCNFCHMERASKEVEQEINAKGYFILQLEGCPEPITG